VTQQGQQETGAALLVKGPQAKARSSQKPSRPDGHPPLAAHQQRLLQAKEAACKKEDEVLSKVKSCLEQNKHPGIDRRRDRDDQSPGSRSTGSEGGRSEDLSSNTTMRGKGHGSSGSNTSNKSCRDLVGSSASGGTSNTENGSSDSARGSRANSREGSDNSGSRADSRAGSDNGFFDGADVASDQELFASAD